MGDGDEETMVRVYFGKPFHLGWRKSIIKHLKRFGGSVWPLFQYSSVCLNVSQGVTGSPFTLECNDTKEDERQFRVSITQERWLPF